MQIKKKKPAVKKTVVGVCLGERSYEIHIGSGILPSIGPALKKGFPSFGKKLAVVTNRTVRDIYGEQVAGSLERAGFRPVFVTVPDGEGYKNSLWMDFIYGELLKAGLDRGSAIVALGGGVIGDMAGFAAATYMRGIKFVQVPTTLLAQVDSSVGGKTGINHPLGKNMIGAFWQPSLVWADTATLKTLPEREFRAGMAEVIKYGVIRDRDFFFDFLRTDIARITSLEPGAVSRLVRRCCEIKAAVVSEDEREAGLRAILNYGHTIGHAIESLTGYTGLLHGEAVAIGMRVEADIAAHKGILKKSEAADIGALIRAYGLPLSLPPSLGRDEIFSSMRRDKKATGGLVRMALPERIGSVRLARVSRTDLVL